MRKDKGFTLIELLAVIVILAIIALIAVPVIMNIISKARKSAFEDTAYGLISAGEMYYADKLLDPNGMTDDVVFTIANGSFQGTNKLDVKGSLPTGNVKVTKDGKVALAVQNGINCITKDYDDSAITTTEYVEGQCYFPGTLAYLASTNDVVTSIPSCVTTGICNTGEQIAIKVNKTEPAKTFRVISDSSAAGGKVVLQLEENLGDTVAWISEPAYGCGEVGDYCSYNDKGPITALDTLEERTASWTNLPKGYTTADENTTHTNADWETVAGPAYTAITRPNARARLIKYEEANAIASLSWAVNGLDENNGLYGYWTSSAYAGYSNGAWSVYFGGDVTTTELPCSQLWGAPSYRNLKICHLNLSIYRSKA